MDSGDVESSGAVDFTPDADTSVSSGGPVNKEDFSGKVAAEDVHFHAADISEPDEKAFFDNPKEQKHREKEEQKRIKAEAKRVLRESRGFANCASGAPDAVVESEKRIKKEQERLESERRQIRTREFFLRRLKHWYIYGFVLIVVSAAVCAAIFVPRIIEARVNEDNEKYVEANKTPLLRLFIEVAGKRFNKDEIEGLVAQYGGDLDVDYYEDAGVIHKNDYFLEVIRMVPGGEDYSVYYGFSYKNKIKGVDVGISERAGKYIYYRGDSERLYDNANGAISAYLLDYRSKE